MSNALLMALIAAMILVPGIIAVGIVYLRSRDQPQSNAALIIAVLVAIDVITMGAFLTWFLTR